jgi:SAM-dependent methyltransferase
MTKNEYRTQFNSFANNWRFCVIKHIKNAGTQILKQFRNNAKVEWKNKYGDEVTLEHGAKTAGVYLTESWIIEQSAKDKSNIYGIDITLNNLLHDLVSEDNVTLICKNIKNFNKSILNPIMFDIIIEDSTHNMEDQIKVFEIFKDRLKPDGILVIEDIAPNAYDYFLKLSEKIPNSKLIDLRHIKNRVDDVLFIYENK